MLAGSHDRLRTLHWALPHLTYLIRSGNGDTVDFHVPVCDCHLAAGHLARPARRTVVRHRPVPGAVCLAGGGDLAGSTCCTASLIPVQARKKTRTLRVFLRLQTRRVYALPASFSTTGASAAGRQPNEARRPCASGARSRSYDKRPATSHSLLCGRASTRRR